MVFDGMDINHSKSYDINTSTPSVKEIKTQNTGNIENAISDINSRLELDNLKLELPKTKEQQEEDVKNLVEEITFEGNIKEYFTQGITLKYIQEGVFGVISNKTKNPNYFVDEKGEILLSIVGVKERPFLENGKAFEKAGYIERKEDGLYNMYKVVNGKEVGPIDINSSEYYKAWSDIIFYADIFNKLITLKFNVSETKIGVGLSVQWGSFKFEDLELFLEKKLITQEIFDYGIQEMQKVIVSQCSDERLINMTGYKGESLGIKESDLKRYLEKGYINGETVKKCFYVLPDKMNDLSK